MGRRLMTTVTMIVLLGLVATGALVGWRSLTMPSASEGEEDAPACAEGIERGERLASREVTVSVFNAGDRAGLAGSTLGELTSRGFLEGEAGNAPGSLANVSNVRVLAPNRRDPAARLVARQFGRDTFIQATDQNLGPGVDVVVGDDFEGLVKAPRRITARAPGSGC